MDISFSLDRELPVPLGIQLRGLIEYGIACGELPPGERLPSVRELAERARIEAVLERVRPPLRAIEYRHMPDPNDIERLLLPALESLRSPPH